MPSFHRAAVTACGPGLAGTDSLRITEAGLRLHQLVPGTSAETGPFQKVGRRPRKTTYPARFAYRRVKRSMTIAPPPRPKGALSESAGPQQREGKAPRAGWAAGTLAGNTSSLIFSSPPPITLRVPVCLGPLRRDGKYCLPLPPADPGWGASSLWTDDLEAAPVELARRVIESVDPTVRNRGRVVVFVGRRPTSRWDCRGSSCTSLCSRRAAGRDFHHDP